MNVIRCFSVFFSAFVFFTFLFGCNRNKEDKNHQNSEVLNPQNGTIDEPSATEEEKYLLRLENQTLTLYELSDLCERVIKSTNINKSYYPNEDILRLEEGIKAETLQQGFEILENFTN